LNTGRKPIPKQPRRGVASAEDADRALGGVKDAVVNE
jgi:hypothetical protein